MTEAAPLPYRPFSKEEIAALPTGTLLAQTWESSPDPEIFRRSDNGHTNWALLTGSPQDFDWERWTHDEVHSEHALYAVIYLPA